MVIALALPFLVFVVGTIWYLQTIKKHDGVLFYFCDLRRDMISYLYEKRDEISEDEYSDLRFLLHSVSNAIHFYTAFKTNVFNIRRMKQMVTAVDSITTKIDRIRDTKIVSVHRFSRRFEWGVMQAFFAYTPFLRTEATYRIVVALVNFIARASRKSFGSTFLSIAEKMRSRSELVYG